MRSGQKARQPRAPGLLPLALLGVLLVLGWVGHRRGTLARVLPRLSGTRPPLSSIWIDPATLVGEGWGSTTDPRWGDELRHELSQLPPFRVDDERAAGRLRATLLSLSFIAAVETLRVSQAGIEIELALREPVACVPVGKSFRMVDVEGVLLSGTWPSPTRWMGAPLPVLGPLRDGGGLFLNARAGDWLVEPEHLDALDVAASLRENLSLEERRALGRIVIDATRARQATVAEPGVRLQLEGRRLVLFGRAPSANEPGELASEHKWRSLARALRAAQADPIGLAWDLVDVRWDEPDIVLRNPRVALAVETPRATRVASRSDHAPSPAPRALPVRSRPDDRPRVR